MWIKTLLLVIAMLLLPALAHARSVATPWTSDISYANLIYGASTPYDIQQMLGRTPDEIVRQEQMMPVIEQHYFYDMESQNGSASVFVFENNLLVGLLYKSPANQFVDLTSTLMNNGDRQINQPVMGGFQGYYPYLPLFGF
jgi:hypothetical protein